MTREGEEGAGEVSCIPDADNVSVVVLWQRVCGCVEAGRGWGTCTQVQWKVCMVAYGMNMYVHHRMWPTDKLRRGLLRCGSRHTSEQQWPLLVAGSGSHL